MLHAGFSVKTFLLQWTQLHFAAFRIYFGDFSLFFLSSSGFFPATCRIRAEGCLKKADYFRQACLEGRLRYPDGGCCFANKRSCWSVCTCNLYPEGSHDDILLTSWRAVMVKFKVALEPTVLQIPLYRTRAVQDLCQDLCYLNQLPLSFTCMQVSVVKTPETSIFCTCLPARLLSEEKQWSVTGFAFPSAFTT